MAPNHHDLVGEFAAPPFGDDVGRLGASDFVATKGVVYLKVGVLFKFGAEPVGVVGANAGCGDFRHALFVGHGAGMGEVVVSVGQATDQHAHRSIFSRL